MKKIFSLLLVAIGFSSFIACSDDNENPYAHVNTITVEKANLDFSARSGEGSVVFKSTEGSVSVTTSTDWCTAHVVGDSIVVNVEQNGTLNGRSAMLVLRNGVDTLSLPVTQRGVVAQFVDMKTISIQTDDVFTGKYAMTTNVDMSIAKTPDWVEASFSGDTLCVTTTENNTGVFRSGYIVYKSEPFVDSIRVFQADFDKDIAGDYKLFYENANGVERSTNVSVTASNIKFSSSWNMPFTYDADNGLFKVYSGCYIGKSSSSFIYLAFGIAGNLWTGYTNTVYVTAPLEYDSVNGIVARFTGEEQGFDFESFMLRRFSANQMSENNDEGKNVLTFYHPYLQRSVDNQAKASSYVMK